MKKLVLIITLMLLVAMLFGCSPMSREIRQNDTLPQLTTTQPPAPSREVVLARSSLVLSVGDNGVKKQSVPMASALDNQLDLIVSMPELLEFKVSGNISFNILTNTIQEADGSFDISVIYNHTLETGLNQIYIRARLLEGNGLIGKTRTSSLIPLEIKENTSDYIPLTSANCSIKAWSKPFKDIISQSVKFKLRGDFSRAISQQYQGTIVFELVKEVSPQDPTTWVGVSNNARWPVGPTVQSFVFQQRLWLISAESVWSSTDGSNWLHVSDTFPWCFRGNDQYIVFNNEIYALGAGYRSANGCTWTRLPTANLVTPARRGFSSIVFNQKLWIFGGAEYTDTSGTPNFFNDSWSTVDGTNWMRVTEHTPWVSCAAQTSLVFNNRLWMFGVRDEAGQEQAWSSPDGVNWIFESTNLPGCELLGKRYVVYNNLLYLISGDQVWSSVDGHVWEITCQSAPWWDLGHYAPVVFNQALWVLGGCDQCGLIPEVWTSQ